MKAFALHYIPLFGDLTAIYCVFLFFTHAAEAGMMSFSFPAYALCGIFAVAVSRRLARKERTLMQVVVVCGFAVLLTEAVMFLAPHRVMGWVGYIVAAGMFTYPVLRALYLSRQPPTASTMLTYCDISVLGTGLFFVIQLSPFQPGVQANCYCMLALGLHIYALSSQRSAGAARKSAASGASAQRTLIVAVSAVLLLLLTALLGFLLMPGSVGVIVMVLAAIRDGIAWIFEMLWRLLLAFFSLFPTPDGSMEIEPQPEFILPEEMERAGEPKLWLLLVLLGIAALGTVALLFWLLMRFRKLKLRWGKLRGNVLEEKSDAPSLWAVLKAAFARLGKKLAFYRLLLARLNTVAGVFVRLELRGRRCGCPRRPEQTPREFLTVLGDRAPDNQAARHAFELLALRIDRLCFGAGGESGQAECDPAQIRLMLRATRPKSRLLTWLWGILPLRRGRA